MAKYRRFINCNKCAFDNKELPIFEEYDPYIHFSDPKVKKIAEETYGDETGKVKAKVWHNINGFTTNFKSSDIEYFPELATMGINYPNAAFGYAFEACKNLKYIIINRKIGNYAFNGGCTNLEYVILENTNKTDLVSIDYSSFNGCSKLKHIKLPDTITRIINGGAFNNTGVTSINKKDDRNTFDLNNVNALGSSCFSNCKKLEYADISKIEELGNNVFDSDPLLKTVILNPNLTKLGNNVFYDCKLLEMNSLPEGLTSIGNNCFYNCNNITLSELPESITTIGSNCFYHCINITLSELPEGITSIGNGCFQGCTNITLTELPEGITSLGNDTFNGCTNLALTKLPEGITSLGKSTFNNCTNLALTKLPEGITYIGDACFHGCKNITLTELPEGITSLGNECLYCCINCKFTKLPLSLKNIQSSLFNNYGSGYSNVYIFDFDESIWFQPNLITMGSNPFNRNYFKNLDILKEINMPELKSIGTIGIYNYQSNILHAGNGQAEQPEYPKVIKISMPKIEILTQDNFHNFKELKQFNSDIDGVADISTLIYLGGGDAYTPGSVFAGTKLTKFILPNIPPDIYGGDNNFPSGSKFYVSSEEVKQAYLNDEKWSLFDPDRFVIGTMETIRQEMETL